MAEITTPTHKIRYATEKDIPSILQMVQELASYERALHEVIATEADLYKTLRFPTSSDPAVRGKGGGEVAWCLLVTPVVATDSSPSQPESEPEAGSNGGAREGEVAGMALYFNNYSTWLGKPGIYLEDLFVRPAYRKRGFGKALLQALARECVENGWGRLEWSVLRWNEPSIMFYESEAVGAVSLRDEWEGMRVQGDALVRLARATGGDGAA